MSISYWVKIDTQSHELSSLYINSPSLPSFYPNFKVLLKTKLHLTNSILLSQKASLSIWPRWYALGLLDVQWETTLNRAQQVNECVY